MRSQINPFFSKLLLIIVFIRKMRDTGDLKKQPALRNCISSHRLYYDSDLVVSTLVVSVPVLSRMGQS